MYLERNKISVISPGHLRAHGNYSYYRRNIWELLSISMSYERGVTFLLWVTGWMRNNEIVRSLLQPKKDSFILVFSFKLKLSLYSVSFFSFLSSVFETQTVLIVAYPQPPLWPVTSASLHFLCRALWWRDAPADGQVTEEFWEKRSLRNVAAFLWHEG